MLRGLGARRVFFINSQNSSISATRSTDNCSLDTSKEIPGAESNPEISIPAREMRSTGGSFIAIAILSYQTVFTSLLALIP